MKTIVVATDFSQRGELAVARARVLAETTGADLLLVHAIDDDLPTDILHNRKAEAERHLAAECARIGDGTAVARRVVTGDVYWAIDSAAKAAGADLVVAGDHRRNFWRDTFRDTTVERFVRFSEVPVLIARQPASEPYRHALLGVESFEPADLAPLFAAVAAIAPRRLTALHAFTTIAAGMMVYAGVDRQEIDAHRREAAATARSRLQAALRRTDAAAGALPRVLEGEPAEALQKVASEEGCDLVAVATHARRGLVRGLLGSVSSELIRHGTTDLLVLPRIATDTPDTPATT
ncbi:universal stress protein [Faunimonas sp. B44]|uniref:universal stress protein n=1 Tax=Faunimonas sp. B44 TaxID=3461493 RepID=UPI004043D75F